MRWVVVLGLIGCGRIGFDDVGDGRSFKDTVDNCGFAMGAFTSTRIAGADVVIDPSRSNGSFTSRIFDAGETTTWKRIEWSPEGPYGIALPNGRARELYRTSVADMSENILLLHADITNALGVGAKLEDSSGRNNTPVVVGAPIAPGNGAFGGGIADTEPARLAIDLAAPASAADFSFGTGDWTWSLWLQTSAPCTGVDSIANDTYIGADDDRTIGGEHLWFGCVHPTDPNCPAQGATDSRLGGTLISMSGGTDGGSYCGTRSITDGVRHHLVLTKTNHSPATIETWIDGVKDFSGPIMFAVPIVFEDMKTWNLVGEPGTRVSGGDFDEIAIWRRALSPAELRAIYLRGKRLAKFRVRGCEQADCSDGTFGSFMVDPGGVGPDVSIDLQGVTGRYLQYEMLLGGTNDVDGSPAIQRVQLYLE